MRQGMLQREKMEKMEKMEKARALCSFHYLFVAAASHCSLSFSIIFGFLPVIFANFFRQQQGRQKQAAGASRASGQTKADAWTSCSAKTPPASWLSKYG